MFYLSALKRMHSLGDASAPRNVTAVPGCGRAHGASSHGAITTEKPGWGGVSAGAHPLLPPADAREPQISEGLDNPTLLSSALQVQLFMGVCVLFEGGAPKIPFRPLCTLHLGEHKSAKKLLYLPSPVAHIPT